MSLPKTTAQKLAKQFEGKHLGWRSLPVIAKIGKTEWKTSIFADNRTGSYLFPLKAEVRKKERIVEGNMVRATLTINL